MIILVAVDIVEDQVVRLSRGELEERTVYGHDPVEAAVEWEAKGAEWLHVIDLDGATRGEQSNSKAVERILQSVKIPVQVGGGIRSVQSIESWLAAGATRVCVGTKLFDPEFLKEAVSQFSDSLVAAVDARGGEVRVGGWLQGGGATPVDTVKRLEDSGVRRIMFTDIERDGTLLGPNIEAIEEILEVASIPVIASGGVDMEQSVRELAKLNLEGVIIGKALYSGAMSLEAAKAACLPSE